MEFTLVGFGFDTFITTFGGSFHALAGLESWYDGSVGPGGDGTLERSADGGGGTGVVCPNRKKKNGTSVKYIQRNSLITTNHGQIVDST